MRRELNIKNPVDSLAVSDGVVDKEYLKKFKKIITSLQEYYANLTDRQLALLSKAFTMAINLHKGQYRKSGESYIIHPLAVAQILADFGVDTTTIAAALLHDTVEDTSYSLEQLTQDFNPEIAHLVDGVTKLDQIALGNAAEAETIRKMVIAMSEDPRVLVIKVGDRLHNMRTIEFLPAEKQHKKAKETLEVIAPLAHRLGMAGAAFELEDLAFSILYPKQYEEIVRLVAARSPSRDNILKKLIIEIEKALEEAGIKATVTGRPKHYWSIYQKMVNQEKDFDDIFDLIGIRIITKSTRDCYASIGVVHAKWQPMTGRFKDYIAHPKYGVYQSLHTTLVGPAGKALEVQVRTKEMDVIAEYGIAAHWRYKETKGQHKSAPQELENIAWMRQLLDWQKDTQDSGEFLTNLRFDLAVKEIFVLTPKGGVSNLPLGSTPVDFAYSIHSEVGNKCIGARVNKKMVPLDTVLKTGDIVEVLTSKALDAGPSLDWLKFVVSARAKAKIKQWFAKERRAEAIDLGKEAIVKEAKRLKLANFRLLNTDNLMQVVEELNLSSIDMLYNEVGENHLSAKHVVNMLVNLLNEEEPTETSDTSEAEKSIDDQLDLDLTKPSSKDSGISIGGTAGIPTKLAKCCLPVPGDKIVGLVTRRGVVSIHRKNCVNIASLSSEDDKRLIEVEWISSPHTVYLVAIELKAMNRERLLSDISKVLSDAKLNMVSADLNIGKEMTVTGKFTLEIGDLGYLQHVISILHEVDGVYDVYRINSQ